MKNIFSIDLESFVHFYEDSLKLRKFSSSERKLRDRGYIQKATLGLLRLLEEYNQKATFFVVAEIDDWYPNLIKEIKRNGHEIGYHTHTHPLIRSKGTMKHELALSKSFIAKYKPRGFRAPQIHLPQEAVPLLEKAGFVYSSSSYDDFHMVKHGEITEIPVSVFSYRSVPFSPSFPKPLSFKLLLSKIPIGSGLSIAVFGSYTSIFIERLNYKRVPAIIFIHPWQLYQSPEIASFSYKAKLLMKNPLCLLYTRNIQGTVEKLFKAHQFTSFHNYFHGQQRILGQ